MRQHLARTVSLAVLTRARTEADHHEDLGCSILGPASRPVRRAQARLKALIRRLGPDQAARQARELVRWLEGTADYDALCAGAKRRQGRRVLRDEVLYPDPGKTPPRFLHVRKEHLGFDLAVPAQAWPTVHELFATLARGASAADLRAFRQVPLTATLLEQLTLGHCLERADAAPPRGQVFVGHNTTLLRGKTGCVLVDPYFRPASEVDLPDYQPLQPRDLPPVDAVVITHSHGDHFHLGSLLQLPREVRVFVPAVERENLFSTDCATRLRQAGFAHVEALTWGERRAVGDVTVTALPFFGEQPTAEPGVHGIVNHGATWLVETPSGSAAFFADSGADARGDMRRVARSLKGRVDALFCGVRGFKVRPIFFGFSTLDAFLVDVPAPLLDQPTQLMADGATALAYAKAMGATTLVPCADGGAPWYWREGMGPRYPGFPGVPVEGASRYDENPDADPYPERVASLRRPGDPSVTLLRPGDEFRLDARHGVRPTATRWPPFFRAAAGAPST